VELVAAFLKNRKLLILVLKDLTTLVSPYSQNLTLSRLEEKLGNRGINGRQE